MLPAQKRGDPVREPRKVSPSPTGFRGTVPACGKRRGLVSTEGHSPETFGGWVSKDGIPRHSENSHREGSWEPRSWD